MRISTALGRNQNAISLVLLLVYAGLALTVYTYLTPPAFSTAGAAAVPLLGRLPGDLPAYSLRFLLTAVMFGLLPLGLLRLPGLSLSDAGLVSPRGFLKTRLFVLIFIGAIVVGLLSSYSPELSAYYPYSHTLLHLALRKNVLYFVLHLTLYFVLYYIPWEILFRGIMILPFLRLIEKAAGPGRVQSADEIRPLLIVVASFQIIPSAMSHFGHPFNEMASAVLFGVLAGWLVVKTRSIIPGLLIHAAVGMSLDTALLLRAAGILPGGTLPGF